MYTSYVTCILCLPDPWICPIIWCLSIITDPEGEALLEAPLADKYGWGPADPEVEPEDGVLLPGARATFCFWV